MRRVINVSGVLAAIPFHAGAASGDEVAARRREAPTLRFAEPPPPFPHESTVSALRK